MITSTTETPNNTEPKSLTIRHTWEDGTVLEGSSKGDGAYEIARGAGFTWMRSVQLIALRRSRDSRADMYRINRAKTLLEATGRFTVTIEVDDTQTRSFADAEQERYERAAGRAERHEELSGNAAARSGAAYQAARAIGDGIPSGQPVLVGHHRERRHRRDLERIDNGMRRSIAEKGKAEYHADRAAAAAGYEEYRRDPGRTLRRIKELEAALRRNARNLAGTGSSGWNPDKYPEQRAQLEARRAEITEQLEYWRGVVKAAEEAGFKVWGSDDFAPGDFLKSRGEWYEVLKVNAKSLTGPHIHNDGPVVTKVGARLDWTWNFPYDDIQGRKSGEEMARLLAEALGLQIAKVSESLAGVDLERQPEEHQRWTARRDDLTRQREHWAVVIEEAEARRERTWEKGDFVRGDFLRHKGRWFEVVRVNAKTVTVPHPDNPGLVVDRSAADSRTAAAPYSEITGRMSAAEMATHLAGQREGGEHGAADVDTE
ncbi:DUF3560 domain-containing protein [Streptomyces sp. NRRL B-24484]|uniref:DUF3560 domain-containing protein n=1 Tax=Streptomyces sp. NRRL B-24484 TaxID=1463833 RepID=UPI00069400A6|nr:DUF3560 domain-containing protein [Streptomyces sp. NRRL B-24484]